MLFFQKEELYGSQVERAINNTSWENAQKKDWAMMTLKPYLVDEKVGFFSTTKDRFTREELEKWHEGLAKDDKDVLTPDDIEKFTKSLKQEFGM